MYRILATGEMLNRLAIVSEFYPMITLSQLPLMYASKGVGTVGLMRGSAVKLRTSLNKRPISYFVGRAWLRIMFRFWTSCVSDRWDLCQIASQASVC